MHTAKQMRGPDQEPPAGAYKVGTPYQVEGVWYYPKANYAYRETGIASWYGPGFHGRLTANGEVYDQNQVTAAHPTLPLPSVVQVTNLENGRSIKVRINDRGPFKNGRIIDLSQRAADLLGFRGKGTAKVLVEAIEDESRQLAAAALGSQAAALAPDAVPVVPVAAEPLPVAGTPTAPAMQATAPAAATQTARLGPAAPLNGVAHPLPAPRLDETVSTVPVAPTSIFIQAGSFARLDNAIKLRARLASLGRVEVAEAMVETRRFFRVRLGPVASVEEADRLLAVLIDNGHTEARVVVD